MNRLIFIIGLVWILQPDAGKAQQSSLGAFQKKAAENNPAVQAAFMNWKASMQKVSIGGALNDPQIGVDWFLSPVETRVGPQRVRILVEQSFPWFGSLSGEKKILAERAKARFEEFQQVRNAVFFDMERVWNKMWLLHKTETVLQKNIGLFEVLEKLTLRQLETGIKTEVDVLRIQIELEELRNALENTRDEQEILLAEFRSTLSDTAATQPEFEDINPEISPISFSKEQILEMAESNPSIKMRMFEWQAQQAEVENVGRNIKPKFLVGLEYTAVESRPVDTPDNGKDVVMAKARFSVPIFGSKNRARTAVARYNENQAELNLQRESLDITYSVEQTLITLEKLERTAEFVDQVQLFKTKQVLDILTESFSAGSTPFEELLRIQEKLQDYELSLAGVTAEWNINRAYLDYLTGKHNITPEEF